jgi:hypothetical protein
MFYNKYLKYKLKYITHFGGVNNDKLSDDISLNEISLNNISFNDISFNDINDIIKLFNFDYLFIREDYYNFANELIQIIINTEKLINEKNKKKLINEEIENITNLMFDKIYKIISNIFITINMSEKEIKQFNIETSDFMKKNEELKKEINEQFLSLIDYEYDINKLKKIINEIINEKIKKLETNNFIINIKSRLNPRVEEIFIDKDKKYIIDDIYEKINIINQKIKLLINTIKNNKDNMNNINNINNFILIEINEKYYVNKDKIEYYLEKLFLSIDCQEEESISPSFDKILYKIPDNTYLYNIFITYFTSFFATNFTDSSELESDYDITYPKNSNNLELDFIKDKNDKQDKLNLEARKNRIVIIPFLNKSEYNKSHPK